MHNEREKVAIVGGGVAGLTAAYLLSEKHDVTLFEKNDYIGGHTHTITIQEGVDAGLKVDTGFIVFNEPNYPLFGKLLQRLGVASQESDMSFGFYSPQDDFCYSSYFPGGLFAQKKNLWSPKFYGMIREIIRFNKQSVLDLDEGKLDAVSLGDYLKAGGYGEAFMTYYLLPMGSAIWSMTFDEMFSFPAQTFVQFFKNHCLLTVGKRPQWRTVSGGSDTYVKEILKALPRAQTNVSIKSVMREDEGVSITFEKGETERFDSVVLATHADEALKLLGDPTEEEQRLLGAWSYSKNDVILHTDVGLMPKNKKAWASWNYLHDQASDGVSVTYDMNRLQNLRSVHHYFVSLNTKYPVLEKEIVSRMLYTHPVYSAESIATQEALPSLNGAQNTFFCGSYFGYGFHEDAVRSAVHVAEAFGVKL